MKLIDKPGIYDLTMEQYHGQPCVGPSVSSTGLRTIHTQSPAHYWVDSSLNPDRDEEEDDSTAALDLGRAAHHLFLGEADFGKFFTMRPETIEGAAWQGNRTACKKWLSDRANEGITVLKGEQIKHIKGMSKALNAHPLVQNGILNGQIEKSLIWKDEETGIWLKARPDAIPNDSGDFSDLKTTVETGIKLDRSVSKFRYDMQAALVKMGAKAALGIDMTEFSFVFVEKTPPYCVDVLVLKPEDIALAELDIRVALRTLAYCIKTDDWFGPSGTQRDARYVHIGEFTKKDAQARREFLEAEIRPAQMAATQIAAPASMQAAE
jgi:hypothetical protein